MAALIALAFYIAFYDQAHPEAALNLTVGREEARAHAKSFLRAQGFDVSHYRHAIALYTYHDVKEFLEKAIGFEEANRVMGDEVCIWFWYGRFFELSEKEEFWVALGPDGRLVGYDHVIEDELPGASLLPEEAQAIAQAFLDELKHVRLAEHRPVKSSRIEQAHRVDHYFTWEQKGSNYGGATYQIKVGVKGDQIGHYDEFLNIPEEWEAEQNRKYSYRVILRYLANIIRCAFGVAIILVLFLKIRARQAHFRFALTLGLLVAALELLLWVNELPSAWMKYHTGDSGAAFYGRQALKALLTMLAAPLGLLVLASPGEALAREVFPEKAPLSRMVTREFWCSKETFTATAVGGCLAIICAAYYSAFYIAGAEVGVWFPQDTPYSNSLAMPLPWVYPLVAGLKAALKEEFIYRLFAISLLMRLTRRPWLSISVPAIVWAFGHTLYPQEPEYIRGVELTAVGIVYGLVFLRYGFIATFVAHYTYNALAESRILFQSGDLYVVITAALVIGLMAIALLPGIGILLRRKRLATVEEVRAAPMPIVRGTIRASARRGEEAPLTYAPFTPLQRGWLLTLAIAGVTGVLISALVPRGEGFGDFVQVSINRQEAQKLANAYLRARGVMIESYHSVTWFQDDFDGDEADYVWQHIGLEGLNRFFGEHLAGRACWRTRYFIPGQKEEFNVYLDPGGTVINYQHTIEEDRSGAILSQEGALRLAESFLHIEKGLDLGNYRLVDSSTREFKARNDHWFTWEDTTAKAGAAKLRLSLKVQGDEVLSFWPFLEIPDTWYRARSRRTLEDVIVAGTGVFVGIAAGTLGITLIVSLVTSRLIALRFALLFGGILAVCEILINLIYLPMFWASYSTTTPPFVFMTRRSLDWFLMEPIGKLLGGCFLAAVAIAMFRRAFPNRYPVGYWFGLGYLRLSSSQIPSRGNGLPLKLIWGEALLIACLCALASLGVIGVIESDLFEEDAHDEVSSIHEEAPSSFIIGGYSHYFPAAISVLRSLQDSIAGGMALILIGGIFSHYIRSLRRVMLLLVPVSAYVSAQAFPLLGEPIEVAFSLYVVFLLLVSLAYALARWVYRDNLPAYFLTIFLVGVPYAGLGMLSVPDRAIKYNGVALLGLFCVCVALGVWLYIRGKSEYRVKASTAQF